MSADPAAATGISGASSVAVSGTGPSGASAVQPADRGAFIAWRWRVAAFLLTGAAQLITIGSLTYLVHPAITWAALLLATAPVVFAALAAFAPRPLARWAVVAAIVVIIVAGAAWITHASWLFGPALIALAVSGLQLWRTNA
jgi:hypothetical protein